MGWISEGGLNYVCERLTVPPAEAYGVATFYAMFSVAAAADDRRARLRRPRLPDQGGQELARPRARGARAPTGRLGRCDVDPSPCLGMCEQAPAVLAQRARAARTWRSAGRRSRPSARPSRRTRRSRAPGRSPRRRRGTRTFARASGCSRRVGVVDPSSIDDYRAQGGYAALRRAVELGPEGDDPGGHRREAPRPRRRGVPHGREVEGGRRAVGSPALRDLQRRRIRAGDLQGPPRDGARSVRRASRRSRSPASRPGRNGATSTSAVSTRSRRNGWSTRSTRRGATATSATT